METILKESRNRIFFILIILCLSIGGILASEKKSDEYDQSSNMLKSGWYLDTSIGLKYNYDGLGSITKIYYRLPLFHKPGILWKNTGMDIGMQEFISPAFQRISAYLKIEPIAFFDIASYAGYDYMYKGITGGMKVVESPDSGYDSDSLDKIDGRARGGFRMSLIPSLKFAYSDIAAIYSFKIDYHNYNHNLYYYDYETNLIHKGEDMGFRHNAIIAYLLGPYHNIGSFALAVIFSDYQVKSTGKNSMSISGGLLYTANWSVLGERVEPYFQLSCGSYIQDRYMKGKPSFALAFGLKLKL